MVDSYSSFLSRQKHISNFPKAGTRGAHDRSKVSPSLSMIYVLGGVITAFRYFEENTLKYPKLEY